MKAELKKDLVIEFPMPSVQIPSGSEIELIDFFDYDNEMYTVFRYDGFTYIKAKNDLKIEVILEE